MTNWILDVRDIYQLDIRCDEQLNIRCERHIPTGEQYHSQLYYQISKIKSVLRSHKARIGNTRNGL